MVKVSPNLWFFYIVFFYNICAICITSVKLKLYSTLPDMANTTLQLYIRDSSIKGNSFADAYALSIFAKANSSRYLRYFVILVDKMAYTYGIIVG